jgi:hypothetical protein
MPICEFEDCKTESSFNFKGYPRKFCNKHKEPDMINVKDFICIFDNCKNPSYYNYNGLKEKLYCIEHKLENMINVKSKICEYKKCTKQPCFNYKNNIKGKYCFEHKEPLMVDIKHKHCNYKNCNNRANYNYFGKTILYCVEHKLNDMINVSSRKCLFENCKKYPNFNFLGEISGIYCSSHKLESMIDVVNKKCLFENCKKSPNFNFSGETSGIYCYTHKLNNMTDVVNKKCLFENCNIQPHYNYENEITSIYCSKHKLDKMVHIKYKSNSCKTPLCQTSPNKKYEGLCLRCYIHTYPDKPVTRNYKTKEQSVVDYIKNEFQNLSIVFDKIVQDGCSKKRPDIQIDLGYQVIIVEIDENQHKSYDCSCENKRLMEISQDYNHRPIIFIRFNPDEYTSNGIKIKSCWKLLKNGIMTINKSKELEWDERLNNLKTQIEYWCNPNNITNKTVEVIQLYYNQ